MEFAQPQWLILLLLVPLLGFRSWWMARRSTGLRFSAVRSIREGPRTIRNRIRAVPAILRMTGLSLAVIAMARPQDRDVVQERFAEGVDIVMVLDTTKHT